MIIHELKIDTKHFWDVVNQRKKAEMRLNDRNFQVGDEIILHELENGTLTGNGLYVVISHILTGVEFGIIEGYCMLSIEVY